MDSSLCSLFKNNLAFNSYRRSQQIIGYWLFWFGASRLMSRPNRFLPRMDSARSARVIR
jgi:hypothetical protein